MKYITHNLIEFLSVVAVGFLAMLITTLISLILLKMLWAGTIPCFFPGLVERGLIADSISLWAATKLSILAVVLGGRFIKVGINQISD